MLRTGLLSSAVLFYAAVASGDDKIPSFEEWKALFNQTFAEDEEPMRRTLYSNRVKEIAEHNALKLSYRLGVNSFSALSQDEFKIRLGSSRHNRPAMAARGGSFHTPLEALPASVDWRTKGVVTPVKNQGNCGSCWAFASTETIESHAMIDAGKLYELSPQQLVSCSTNPKHCGGTGGCQGSIAELAYQYAETAGLSLETDYPYRSGGGGETGICDQSKIKPVVKVTGFHKLIENNYTDVMNAIATVGPLAVNVWAAPWMAYSGGIYSGCPLDQNQDIDHVVQLVGYGTDEATKKDYWLVRNSWGETWGEKGYIRLERFSSSAHCGTDTTPQDGTGCSGGPSKVTTCGTCGLLYDVSYPTVEAWPSD